MLYKFCVNYLRENTYIYVKFIEPTNLQNIHLFFRNKIIIEQLQKHFILLD